MATRSRDDPLRRLGMLGRSSWLDDQRRRWLEEGTLAQRSAERGLAGVHARSVECVALTCEAEVAKCPTTM